MVLTEEEKASRPFTAEDAAEYLQVHVNTITRMIKEGKLKACKVGREWRITREELDEFVKRGGEPTMEQIIERLKSQKNVVEGNWRAVGLGSAVDLIKAADYPGLKHAVEVFNPYGGPILESHELPGLSSRCEKDPYYSQFVQFDDNTGLYDLNTNKISSEPKRIHTTRLFRDPFLGPFFKSIATKFRGALLFEPVNSKIDNEMIGLWGEGLIGTSGEEFIEGLLEAVKAFWAEEAPKL